MTLILPDGFRDGFRAADEDEEFQSYLASASAPRDALALLDRAADADPDTRRSALTHAVDLLDRPKLWRPGETMHRTKGGNLIIRPLNAAFTSLEVQTDREVNRRLRRLIARAAIGEAERIIRDARRLVPVSGGAGPSAWGFTNSSRTNMLSGNQAIGTDTFKMSLFLSTSNIAAGSNVYSSVTNEVANATGYTTGGVSVTLSLSGTTTVTVAITDASWTASGGTIVFRFMVVYEVSNNVTTFATADSAPADVTVQSGNTVTVSGANNLYSLA